MPHYFNRGHVVSPHKDPNGQTVDVYAPGQNPCDNALKCLETAVSKTRNYPSKATEILPAVKEINRRDAEVVAVSTKTGHPLFHYKGIMLSCSCLRIKILAAELPNTLNDRDFMKVPDSIANNILGR